MAAPIIVANQAVQRWIPGGWKTVGGVVAVIIIVIALIISGLVSAVKVGNPDKSLQGDACAVAGGDSDPSKTALDDNEGTKDSPYSGGGSGKGKALPNGGRYNGPNLYASGKNDPTFPFPKESTSKTYMPAAKMISMASSFGYRAPFIAGGVKTASFHDGTDIAAPNGSPALAFADGIVTLVSRTPKEGGMVQIQHTIDGKPYTTAYRHLIGKKILVESGQIVKGGERIASVGMEGIATGPHIHFVLANGVYKRYQSSKNGPAFNAIPILKGSKKLSGGADGKDFDGKNPDTEEIGNGGNPGEEGCADAGGEDGTLPGDGTTEWNNHENGKFGKSDLAKVGKFDFYVEGASALSDMMAAYKKDTKKNLSISKAYLSFDEQKKLYDAKKQTEKPGESIYGWARMVQFTFKNDPNSAEYKWLTKKASEFGFEQPETFKVPGGPTGDARVWSYKGGGEGTGEIPKAGSASAKEAQAIAKKIFEEKYPDMYSEREFGCLVSLWHHESGWNYKAANPTSTARGIPQRLMGYPLVNSAKGKAWQNSPAAQIEWGLNYFGTRPDYKGSPCRAWALWQSRSPHWY